MPLPVCMFVAAVLAFALTMAAGQVDTALGFAWPGPFVVVSWVAAFFIGLFCGSFADDMA